MKESEMNKKWIYKLLDEETKGLNMKKENARNELIFSYNDVVEIIKQIKE